MSHYIPVFFFPIEREAVPEDRKDWDSAMDILKKRLERRNEHNLWKCTSRNWWLQHALLLICKGLGVGGLEFIDIDIEIAYLDNKELEAASNALDKVLREICNGIPYLGPEIDKEGSIWWLHHYRDKGRDKEYSIETMRRAFSESEATYEIDIFPDSGYESVVGFYSFLKSLQAAVNETMSQDMSLMYFQMQP
jgi:hypothetical protein